MEHIDTVVIGAGHAGLAMSNILSQDGVEHVVLERDHVASSWQQQRWDSFTLLTPNWATWLPNWHYQGDDPHGFMGRDDVVAYFEAYAKSFAAPVRTGVEVQSLAALPAGGYRLTTDAGEISARRVVISTGPFQRAKIPDWSRQLPSDITQLHSSEYRSPAQLPGGAVLVIGTGPSGQQIAEDLLRAGRRVYLSVGRHRRVPRRYRGRDYYWWQELGGFYEKIAEDVPAAKRHDSVSPALTGFAGGHDLDLRHLHADGVMLLGRAVGSAGGSLQLDDALARNLATGDVAYTQFTDWVESRLYRFDGMFDEAEPRKHYADPPESPAALDLRPAGVSTVVWATGFGLDFERWVNVPIFDPSGRPIHTRGATSMPGLYVLGQGWLHRLRSPFIRGAEEDAAHIGQLVRA